jgi:hypothetical protein
MQKKRKVARAQRRQDMSSTLFPATWRPCDFALTSFFFAHRKEHDARKTPAFEHLPCFTGSNQDAHAPLQHVFGR